MFRLLDYILSFIYYCIQRLICLHSCIVYFRNTQKWSTGLHRNPFKVLFEILWKVGTVKCLFKKNKIRLPTTFANNHANLTQIIVIRRSRLSQIINYTQTRAVVSGQPNSSSCSWWRRLWLAHPDHTLWKRHHLHPLTEKQNKRNSLRSWRERLLLNIKLNDMLRSNYTHYFVFDNPVNIIFTD